MASFDASGLPEIVIAPTDSAELSRLVERYPGGCIVRLLEGTYALTRPIRLGSNMQIAGAARTSTTLVLAENSNCHVIENVDRRAGNRNIALSRLSVEGNGHAQQRPDEGSGKTFACGVRFDKVSEAWFEDIAFSDIRQTALHFNNCLTIVIRDVEARQVGWSGIGTTNVSDLLAERIVVRQAGLDVRHSAIHLNGGVGNYVDADIAEVTGNGIMLDSSHAPLRFCEVSARVTSSHRGLSLSGEGEIELSHVLVTGDYSGNDHAGVMISNATDVFLGACTIRNNRNYGVLFQGRTGGKRSMVSRSCVVENNGVNYAQTQRSRDNWVFGGPGADPGEWAQVNASTLEDRPRGKTRRAEEPGHL